MVKGKIGSNNLFRLRVVFIKKPVRGHRSSRFSIVRTRKKSSGTVFGRFADPPSSNHNGKHVVHSYRVGVERIKHKNKYASRLCKGAGNFLAQVLVKFQKHSSKPLSNHDTGYRNLKKEGSCRKQIDNFPPINLRGPSSEGATCRGIPAVRHRYRVVGVFPTT